jgi:hypothetical protein
MFTTIDKALTALIMAAIFLLNYFFGFNLGWITSDAIASIVAALTPFLVWLVPNKKAA